MLRIAVRLFPALFLLLVTGCDRQADPTRMTSGVELYNYYCKDCHAKLGPGGAMERSRTDPPLQVYQIIMLVKYGYRQNDQQKHLMPTFSQITDEQAEALANHVLQLQQAAAMSKPSS